MEEKIKEEIIEYLNKVYSIFKNKTTKDVVFRYTLNPQEERIEQGIFLKDKVHHYIIEDKENNIFIDCGLVDPYSGCESGVCISDFTICKSDVPFTTENGSSQKRAHVIGITQSFTSYYNVNVSNSLPFISLENRGVLKELTNHILSLLKQVFYESKNNERVKVFKDLQLINSLL
jgi:hypothetical protein